MFRTLFSILIIIASLGAIIFVAAPEYQKAKEVQLQASELDGALANAAQLRALRTELENKFNAISHSDREKIETILPAYIDNVQLSAIDINGLAENYGLTLRDVNTVDPKITTSRPDEVVSPIGSIHIELSLEGQYANFVSFLSNLEKSLRIIDVDSVIISPKETNTPGQISDMYTYDVVITTYWLRPVDSSALSSNTSV